MPVNRVHGGEGIVAGEGQRRFPIWIMEDLVGTGGVQEGGRLVMSEI